MYMNQIVLRNEVVFRNAAHGEYAITVTEPADVFDPERMEPYLREAEEAHLKHYTWDDIVTIKVRCLDVSGGVITQLPLSLETLHINISTLSGLFISPECTRIYDIQIIQSNMHIMPDVTHLSALVVCIIGCSNLEIIPFAADQWPASLNHLDLGANSFTSYNLDIMSTLPKKCYINLSGNELSIERLRANYWAHQGYRIDFGVAPAAGTRNRLQAMQSTYRFSPVTPDLIHYYTARAHLGAQHPRAHKNVIQPLAGTQTVHVSSICDSVTRSVCKIRKLTDAKYTTTQKDALISEFIRAAYKTLPVSAPFYKRILAFSNLYTAYNSQTIDFINLNSRITDIHSPTKTTYGELLARVWILVRDHPQRDDFLVNVKYEIQESVGYCFTGRFNRLVNALIGFVDGVTVGISVKEQLQLEMGRLIASLGNGDITFDKCMVEFTALFDDPLVAADGSITKAYKDAWIMALDDYRPEPDPEPKPEHKPDTTDAASAMAPILA
jgi:hypothetical protein